jgi:hypothetical protein
MRSSPVRACVRVPQTDLHKILMKFVEAPQAASTLSAAVIDLDSSYEIDP